MLFATFVGLLALYRRAGEWPFGDARGDASPSEGWWAQTPPRDRRRFAVAMLAVDGALVALSVSTTALKGRGGTPWTILGVVVGAFLACQAWRAHNEIRDARGPR